MAAQNSGAVAALVFVVVIHTCLVAVANSLPFLASHANQKWPPADSNNNNNNNRARYYLALQPMRSLLLTQRDLPLFTANRAAINNNKNNNNLLTMSSFLPASNNNNNADVILSTREDGEDGDDDGDLQGAASVPLSPVASSNRAIKNSLPPTWFPFPRRGSYDAGATSSLTDNVVDDDPSDLSIVLTPSNNNEPSTSENDEVSRALEKDKELTRRLMTRMLEFKRRQQLDEDHSAGERFGSVERPRERPLKRQASSALSLNEIFSPSRRSNGDDDTSNGFSFGNFVNNNNSNIKRNSDDRTDDEADRPKSRRRTLRQIFQ